MLLVLAYNLARFHNPFQIGSAYQLAAFNPVTTPSNQLGYVTPGLYYYVFAPVRLTPAFPFVMLPPPAFYPGVIPNAYSPEIVGGVLTVVPILVVLLAATFVLRRQLADLGRIVLVLVVVSVALMGAISFAVPGGTMRYEADFASLLVLARVHNMVGVAARETVDQAARHGNRRPAHTDRSPDRSGDLDHGPKRPTANGQRRA